MLYPIERAMARWPHCADVRAVVMALAAAHSPLCVDVRA
jgi:hypothetical protein